MAQKSDSNPAAGKKLTKMAAVRQAFESIGKDAKAADIQDHVKREFGLDMTIDHIYNCMSEVRRQWKKKGRKGKKKKAAAAAAPAAAAATAAPKKAAGGAGSVSLEDLEATQALVKRLGVDGARRLINLLAR
jgi:hypothetical protein